MDHPVYDEYLNEAKQMSILAHVELFSSEPVYERYGLESLNDSEIDISVDL